MRRVHRDWISYLERRLFAARFAARRWVFYYLCREGSVQAEAALRLYLLLLLLLMLCVGDIGKSDAKKSAPALVRIGKVPRRIWIGTRERRRKHSIHLCYSQFIICRSLLLLAKQRRVRSRVRIRSIIRAASSILLCIQHANCQYAAFYLLQSPSYINFTTHCGILEAFFFLPGVPHMSLQNVININMGVRLTMRQHNIIHMSKTWLHRIAIHKSEKIQK